MIAGVLLIALFNAVDVARYYYLRMEVENATQMAAQAGWKTCDVAHLPATTNCSGFSSAVTASVQSSSLSSSVALASGYPSEGWYCVNSTGSLVYVNDVGSKPANCSSVGNASGQPGDYVKVKTTYAYVPIFGSISIGSTLPSPITSTTFMRLQ